MRRIALISALVILSNSTARAGEDDWAAGIGWVAECKRDAMTDKVICSATNYQASVGIFYSFEAKPQFVCIIGHDFPGRTGSIRVDKNKPVNTTGEACISAAKIMPQMLKGQKVITRRYEWPYDYPKDSDTGLSGLRDVMVKVDFLRKHTD